MWIYLKKFGKKTSGVAIKKEIVQNEVLAKELHKVSIRKFEKIKVHSCITIMCW